MGAAMQRTNVGLISTTPALILFIDEEVTS